MVDHNYGPPDPDDDADFEQCGGEHYAQTDPLDPLTSFKDLPSMSGPDIAALVSDLPVKVYRYIAENSYCFIYYIICDCVSTGGTLTCSEPRRQSHFHQEQAHSSGFPGTEENE